MMNVSYKPQKISPKSKVLWITLNQILFRNKIFKRLSTYIVIPVYHQTLATTLYNTEETKMCDVQYKRLFLLHVGMTLFLRFPAI